MSKSNHSPIKFELQQPDEKSYSGFLFQSVPNPNPRKGWPETVNLFSITVQNDNRLLTEEGLHSITDRIQRVLNNHEKLVEALRESQHDLRQWEEAYGRGESSPSTHNALTLLTSLSQQVNA